MDIRAETAADWEAVYTVNRLAFARSAEADLVERLRAAGRAAVSLVAVAGGAVAGHILFSPVTLDPMPAAPPRWLGLAPMAVHPSWQRRGIGSALVRAGLAAAHRGGAAAVVVLGHPGYYPRFGFVPASRAGLGSIYPVPDDTFLALELVPGGFGGHRGLVRYAPEVDAS